MSNRLDFQALLSSLGFSDTWSLYAFIGCILVSFLHYVIRSVLADDDSKLPTKHYSILFRSLGIFILVTLAARHFVVLSGSSSRPFDVVLPFTIASAVLLGTLLTNWRPGLTVAVFSISLATALYRFLGQGSEWGSAVETWLQSYLPYDVEAKVLATGILVFLLVGVFALFSMQTYNDARKAEVEKGNSIGIDTEALEKLAVAIALTVGLLFAMLATGVNLPTISVVTGILAAGVGFAAKDILSNIAAGIVLIWDGSFKVDDVISIEGGGYGWIDRLTLRHAIVKDRDDISILIPYTKLINSTIQNWTHQNQTRVRLKIDIGIDYDTENLDVGRRALERAAKKPSRVLETPGPRVNVIAAGSSAIQLQLRFWIADPKEGIRNIMSDVLEGMIKELKDADVKIPFDTVDVHIRTLPN